MAGILDGSALVGVMPAQPPTLRAKAARPLVSIVRRMVFWLSDQIRSFQLAVAASLQEQAAEIAQLQQPIEALRRDSALRDRCQAGAAADGRPAQFERRFKEILPRIRTLEAAWNKHEELREQQEHLARLNQKADEYLHQTRMQVALQERRLTTLLSAASQSAPDASGSPGTGVEPSGGIMPLTDPIYVEFENLYRGSRADIKRRFEVYIPRLKESKLGSPETAVLDLGCGRGEWLELLRDEGLTGSGVDMNLIMIEECRKLGLSVTVGSAIQHLRSLPDASFGVVTGFHIVEHLVFEDLLALSMKRTECCGLVAWLFSKHQTPPICA